MKSNAKKAHSPMYDATRPPLPVPRGAHALVSAPGSCERKSLQGTQTSGAVIAIARIRNVSGLKIYSSGLMSYTACLSFETPRP